MMRIVSAHVMRLSARAASALKAHEGVHAAASETLSCHMKECEINVEKERKRVHWSEDEHGRTRESPLPRRI
jgi:hypothetical protein